MADSSYVVRGAKMRCQYGTHARRINLPASHGAYVNGKPKMNEEDCRLTVNIPHFGICNCPNNPNTSTVYLIAEDGQQISGRPCEPKLPSRWSNCKEEARVGGRAALMSDSIIYCYYQGSITFLDDGQNSD
ncbi:DUF4280 domain-containing protein [Paenibacillus xylaniclasticus]|uniref:DUF4280 domain-containing protein n=1 Tax=Paenibacillus xylaniclasticus TaxID=588083 RepID=UPI000FD79056|nr:MULTISPECIES: DUF4280 domain-containing protein [Paenibacillus]GFN32146.1 hypothetical protein PCURB6_24060 [Paenibacillus curdlanolyticus]